MKLVSPILLMLILCFASCTNSSLEEVNSLYENEEVSLNISISEMELLSLVNDHRVANGLSKLEFSMSAYPETTQHTEYMIQNGEISHDNFIDRASKIEEKTNALVVAENVAKDYTSCEAALNGWLSSDSHRKTVEGDFSHTSISIKEDANGVAYFTQVFFMK